MHGLESYRMKALTVILLLTASALLSIPLLHYSLASKSSASAYNCDQVGTYPTCTNVPGCYDGYGAISGLPYFNDANCYMRDIFGMDAVNGSSYNVHQLQSVSWGGVNSYSIASSQSNGLNINLQGAGCCNWANAGLRTINSYEWNGSGPLVIATELAEQTSNPGGDGYYASLTVSPSGSSPGSNYISVQINDGTSGNHIALTTDTSGTLTTLWQSTYTSYDWVVVALILGSSNGYPNQLTLAINSYNSASSSSGQWAQVYSNTAASLPITSGYVYLTSSTDSTSNVLMTSRFLSLTRETPVVDASIGMALAYLARSYQPISSANQNPMAVMLDVPGPSLATVDTSQSRDTQMAGEPGVTNIPYWNNIIELPLMECTTNPCEQLGTRALSLTQYSESMIYTFSQPFNLLNVYSGSDPPYLSLIMNETSTTPLSTTYSLEEVYYNTGGDNVNVYLGGQEVFSGNQVGHIASITDPVGTFGARYVARHISRIASNIFAELGYNTEANALGNFMTYYGYGQDFYDPLFFDGSYNYSDNYLWQSSTFPDPTTFSHLPASESSTGTGYWPYKSRLTVPAAQYLYTNVLLGQLQAPSGLALNFAQDVPPEEDALLALHLGWKYDWNAQTDPYGSNAINDLISAMGWDGTGVRTTDKVCTLGPNLGCISFPYKGYPEYDLGVFLTAVSWIESNSYVDLGKTNSTLVQWGENAIAVALGTQDMYQIENLAPGQYTDMADQVGGFFGGYQYSPNYQYSDWATGAISDTTTFLSSEGYLQIDPPYDPGYGFTGTESTGLVTQGLIIYDMLFPQGIAAQYNPTILIDPQPTPLPQGPLACIAVAAVRCSVPITLTNHQSVASVSGMQQLINVDWNNYNQLLDSNVQNVEFFDSSWNPIYAWCESSCSNTATSSNVWVKLDQQIPANGNITINLTIEPLSTNNLSPTGYWGEYPTATSTYAQYDNGAEVFNFYDNFAGTSLDSSWTQVGSAPTINNGYTGVSSGGAQSKSTFNPDSNVLDFYGNPGSNNGEIGYVPQSPTNYPQYCIYGGGIFGSNIDLFNYNGANFGGATLIPTTTSNHVYSIWTNPFASPPFSSASVDYGSATTNSQDFSGSSSTSVPVGMWGGGSFVQWVRVRIMPPYNIMPSVSFGSVSQFSGGGTILSSSISPSDEISAYATEPSGGSYVEVTQSLPLPVYTNSSSVWDQNVTVGVTFNGTITTNSGGNASIWIEGAVYQLGGNSPIWWQSYEPFSTSNGGSLNLANLSQVVFPTRFSYSTSNQYVFQVQVYYELGGPATINMTYDPNNRIDYIHPTPVHYLTVQASRTAGATVTPSSGYYMEGTTIQIQAYPNSGYSFQSWSGTGAGSYSGTNNPATITIEGQDITETASIT